MAAKVLFIANHRLNRSPGQRFRFEQYLGFLKENGFECTISNIISEKDDKYLYSKGNYLKKTLIALKSWWIRLKDLARANEFDIIFIYREALLTPSTYFESQFEKSKAKVIFDFDDAIWLDNVSAANKSLSRLKKPSKTNTILTLADLVFVGNQYLAEYALKYNTNVKIVPTTIDTSYHVPAEKQEKDFITIGWTGTQTTLKYLKAIETVFIKLKGKYREKLKFKIICDQQWKSDQVEIEFVKWEKTKEIEQLQSIDIGIMPLEDDEWSRGKCGFKGLQYMALEIPAVLSPVGVNTDIINHSNNGFLANSPSEWIEIISQLIEDEGLRKRMGENARKTIIQRYSVEAIKEDYLKYFKELLE
ncbi:MAG: glycosyltransferase family 4 protein [Vicingaceae bacterium]